MKLLKKIICLVLVFVSFSFLNCNRAKVSMQPMDGYQKFLNKEEISMILKDKCVDTINFKKGDIVADIGAGIGDLEVMLSLFHDSITFYVQDIDSSVCNQDSLNSYILHYQKVNGKPFSNKFFVIIGTDEKTNLPDDTFDKILMLWTYPYFKNPKAIMTDIKQKLKSNGFLYIINPNIGLENSKDLIQKYGWNASPLEKQISDIMDCGFELINISRNYDAPENPYKMTFKKKL
jgi:ubiquinone/menaquinone biosynthesis C-methylase UbiE